MTYKSSCVTTFTDETKALKSKKLQKCNKSSKKKIAQDSIKIETQFRFQGFSFSSRLQRHIPILIKRIRNQKVEKDPFKGFDFWEIAFAFNLKHNSSLECKISTKKFPYFCFNLQKFLLSSPPPHFSTFKFKHCGSYKDIKSYNFTLLPERNYHSFEFQETKNKTSPLYSQHH